MPFVKLAHEFSGHRRARSFSESESSSSSGRTYTMSDGQDPIEASLTPDEANRIIHSHRKVRYGKPFFVLSSHCAENPENFESDIA
jgi:hypothetical protein